MYKNWTLILDSEKVKCYKHTKKDVHIYLFPLNRKIKLFGPDSKYEIARDKWGMIYSHINY